MSIDQSQYSFSSLLYYGRKPEPEIVTSLCYLVALTDSPRHAISETLPAKRIISWLYDVDEQSLNSKHLEAQETFFKRFFEGGFYPKTPCMVVKKWSPIETMLLRNLQPEVLDREPKILAVATGIWQPLRDVKTVSIDEAKTDEELFWAIIKEVSRLALERKMWVSVVSKPGWSYERAIGSLPHWPADEVVKSGRILWKRTPKG